MVEGSNSKGKELKKRKAKAEREYIPSKKKLRSTDSKQRCSVFIADRDEAYFSEWEVNSKLNITPSKNDGTTVHGSVPGNGPVKRFLVDHGLRRDRPFPEERPERLLAEQHYNEKIGG
jgi:hypothetical protein